MILKKDDDYEEEEILEELIKHEEFNLSED